jgi:hypothetical protein
MTEETKQETYPASVVKVIDEYTVVINRGKEHGVDKGDQFLVYYIEPDEILDPETGESLGNLEVVRGTGSIVHVQPKMSTVKSNRSVRRGRVIRRASSQMGLAAALANFGSPEKEIIEEPEKESVPFDEPSIGDKVKPI